MLAYIPYMDPMGYRYWNQLSMQKFLDPETHRRDSHDFLGTISGCLVTLTFSVCQGIFPNQNDVWLAHCLMGMLYFTHFLEPPSPCVVYWYAANGGCWKINTNTKASLDFRYWNLPARSVTKIIFTLFQPFFWADFHFFVFPLCFICSWTSPQFEISK